jgi:citrate synthase
LEDPDQRIARPRQIYLGDLNLEYVPIDKRAVASKVQRA